MNHGSPAAEPLIARWAVVAYTVIAVLMLAPAFSPDQQIAGSDYVTGGYYFLEYAIRRMNDGHLPKWVPWVYGGVPMHANPGSLFYPTRLLFSAILPIERVMPAMLVVQFALAGIGMHLFARTLGVRHWVAVVGALMFELTGVTFSYVYAGHDGRIIGATMTPLVFYFLTRGVRTGHARWFLALAATIGCIMLSFQLQSMYYVLLGAGAWAVFLLAQVRREITNAQLVRRVLMGLGAVALAFVLGSVNFLPFADYIKESPRGAAANRDYAFSTQFSMPTVETVGFAVPEQAGIIEKYKGDNPFKLHTEYVGALALLLLVVGVLSFRRNAVWQFMGGLTVFMLTICYGSYTPFYALYYRILPGTSKFRSPSIALFMVAFAIVVMALLTLEDLAASIEAKNRGAERTPLPRRLLTALAALSAVGLLISIGTALDGGSRALGWVRFTSCFLIACVVLGLWVRGRTGVRGTAALLSVLTMVDLWIVDHNFLWIQPPAAIVYAEDDVVRYLRTHEPGRVWVFPFPAGPKAVHYMGNGRFGPGSDYLMRFGIPMAGGEHGNQVFRWNRLAGISQTGSVDWHNFVTYPGMMNVAGVKYIISGVPLKLLDANSKQGLTGLKEVYHGTAYIYENTYALKRVSLLPTAIEEASPEKVVVTMRDPDWNPHLTALVEGSVPRLPGAKPGTVLGTTTIVDDDPDRIAIKVNATQPVMLALAENYAEGWAATIDGRDTPVLRTNLAFRGVPVPAGNHDVVFEFKPKKLYAGLWISGIAWAVLIAALLTTFFAARRPTSASR